MLNVSSRIHLSEEAAFAHAADLIQKLEDEGVELFRKSPSSDECVQWRSALHTMAGTSFSRTLAEVLLEKSLAAFQTIVVRYQQQMRTATTNEQRREAIEQLFGEFQVTQPVVQEWCEQLELGEMASAFAAGVRVSLLQNDLLNGKEPPAKQELFAFLRQHGESMLSHYAGGGGGSPGARRLNEEEEDDDDNNEGGSASGESSVALEIFGNVGQDKALYKKDAVIRCLHGLTLSRAQEIKRLWLAVLEKGIHDKVDSLEEDYSVHCLKEFIEWEEEVVESFVHTVLREPQLRATRFIRTHRSDAQSESAVVRAEVDRWCTELKKRLLISFARQRMSKFWDILVEYPDSRGALEDIQQCLQLCPDSGLKGELMDTVRCLLSSRLHKAGTGTEDILAMLIKTIHSLCVLLTKNEQNANMFSVISATLEHLRKRKDGVPAVVQVITQPNSDTTLYADLQATPKRNDLTGEEDFDLDDEDKLRPSARDRPDVLRVLLTAINAKLLVQEYQQTLGAHLLNKNVHDFDTTPEEEALERLKCVFGEDLLFNCVVMLRDIQMSRRTTAQLRDLIKAKKTLRSLGGGGSSGPGAAARGREEQLMMGRGSVRLGANHCRFPGGVGAPLAAAPAAAEALEKSPSHLEEPFLADALEVSVDVLSMTAWPPKPAPRHPTGEMVPTPDKYNPHPSLQSYMDEVAEQYHVLKRNQKLSWVLGQGRIVLELDQQDPGKQGALVKTEHTVSLFHASLILYIKEAEAASGGRVPLSVIAGKLDVAEDVVAQHATRLTPSILEVVDGKAALQKRVASSSRYLFEEAAGEEEEEPPAGLTPEKIKVLTRMITALLKTQKVAKSVKDIHNSMKMFGQFDGTVDDMKKLLQMLVKDGVIALNDAKLYTLPQK